MLDSNKFVNDFEEVLYWNKKNANEINIIEKRKDVSVMGFGKDFNEAYESCLFNLEKKLTKRKYDIILIQNGVPLKNRANFQYHLSATLYKIES